MKRFTRDFMKMFTREQLQKDWCNSCAYKDTCDENDIQYCKTALFNNEQMQYLGEVLYVSDVKIIEK